MSMRYTPLPNYLRSHRKRVALLQRDLAYLLGENEDGTVISRHELSRAMPDLRTALLYEAIYGTPVRELFAGVYHEVERELRIRAGKLLLEARRERVTRDNVARVDYLARLAGEHDETGL